MFIIPCSYLYTKQLTNYRYKGRACIKSYKYQTYTLNVTLHNEIHPVQYINRRYALHIINLFHLYQYTDVVKRYADK